MTGEAVLGLSDVTCSRTDGVINREDEKKWFAALQHIQIR